MATFTNKATLSYTGGSIDSNTVTGELLDVLSAGKEAVDSAYGAGDELTYVISLRNTGSTALTGLTVTDDLGGYQFGETTVYPLRYVAGSVSYYVNGVLQPAPSAAAGPPLVISGLSLPAGGSGVLIYQGEVTGFAPLEAGSTVTNTAVVTGGGIVNPVTVTETVAVKEQAGLAISKSLSPSVVTENGQLTYTFVIENYGNTPANATDNVVVTDSFSPVLDPIAVTFNGGAWVAGTNYTYDAASGSFATVAGQITVPAATYTQNGDGGWSVVPGVSTLVVTGTV